MGNAMVLTEAATAGAAATTTPIVMTTCQRIEPSTPYLNPILMRVAPAGTSAIHPQPLRTRIIEYLIEIGNGRKTISIPRARAIFPREAMDHHRILRHPHLQKWHLRKNLSRHCCLPQLKKDLKESIEKLISIYQGDCPRGKIS